MSEGNKQTNGKGSSPRNIFSNGWRTNYANIIWKPTQWKLIAEHKYVLRSVTGDTEINIFPDDIIEIYAGSEPIVIRGNSSCTNKRVKLYNIPACHIENSGLFKLIQ